MKRSKRLTIRLAAVRMLLATLLLTMTAQTAWATDLTSANLLIDSEIPEGTAGHYYYTMPRQCNHTLTLTEQDISDGKGTFNVYDCGGKNHDQDWYNLNEELVITAPLGYAVRITGTAKTDDNQYKGSEYMSVYDGTSTSGAYLGKFGTTSHSEYYNVDVQSSSNSIMLKFVTSIWNINGRGLNLTVSLVDVQSLISFATINIEQYHRYTGSAVDLGYTVDDSKGNRLTQGTHYNATIKNNNGEVVQSAISEGHYTLTIEGISPYSGSKTVDFWVNENPGVLIDSDIAEGTLGHFFSLMPKSGSATVDLTQSDVATLMIYDDGGKGGGYDRNTPGNFTPKTNGYLLLHAPAGFQIHLTGHVRTKTSAAYLTVHDGNTESAPTLCANVHGENSSAGSPSYKDVTVDVISTGEYMLLHFDAGTEVWDGASEGLILTASIGHSITVADGITHGSVSCDNFWIKGSSTTIPLTVTPDVGYSDNTVSYNDGSNHTLTPDINGAYSFTMPDKPVLVSATFTPTVYSISYELAGGTVATTNPDNYTIESETFTLINPTRTGYEFSGWTGTGLDAASTNVTIVQGTTGNRSYTATWTPISYSISYNGVEGATFETPNPATYTIEDAITLNNPTKDGYTFAGWYDNAEFTGSAVTTISTGSTGAKTFYAKWKKKLSTPDITVSAIADQAYTGSAIEPTVTVKDGETDITNQCDFAFSDNTNLGTATVTITAKTTSTDYDGSTTATFNIVFTTSYVDADGTLHEDVPAIPLDNTMTMLPGGWYVVNSDVNLTTKLTFTGDTHLILADGKTLTIDASNDAGENGVYFGMVCKSVEESTTTYHDLTIYGQTEGTGKISSKMGHGGIAWSYDYYAKNITINGGQVEASGSTKGLAAKENITINGGQVSSQNAYITCGGTLTLGWSNATDFILAKSYIDDQTIAIADGKVFMSGTDLFSGSVTATDINGKKLSPATFPGGMTISSERGKLTANLDDTATGTLDILTAIEVDQVVIERTYVSGKASTVYLPFSIAAANVTGGKFYTFTGVDETETPWKVNYDKVTGDIQANTPYIFLPDGANGGKIVVNNGSDKISVSTANPHTTTQGQWEFIGTYDYIQWLSDNSRADEIGLVYGFAAKDLTVGTTNYEVGQFVKIGSGAFIKPMRAYLKRSATAGARALTRGAAESLPETMTVVLRGANGETTSVIELKNGKMEELDSFDSWYSLDGSKLSGKPTKKGLYINNGKKVVIK